METLPRSRGLSSLFRERPWPWINLAYCDFARVLRILATIWRRRQRVMRFGRSGDYTSAIIRACDFPLLPLAPFAVPATRWHLARPNGHRFWRKTDDDFTPKTQRFIATTLRRRRTLSTTMNTLMRIRPASFSPLRVRQLFAKPKWRAD